MQTRPLLASFAAFAAIAVIAVRASAQSVTLNESGITRDTPPHDPNARLWISRTDCLADDVLHFPVVLTNYAGYGLSLEIWAGESADCSDLTQRSTSAATCWRLYTSPPTAYQMTIPIRVQDIVAQGGRPNGGAGTIADCTPVYISTAPEQVTLYFMLMSGTEMWGTGVKWSTKFNLSMVGPPPPTGVGMSADGTTLTVTWAPNADPDVAGRILLCDPPPGEPAAASDAGFFAGGCTRRVQFFPGAVPSADVVARYQCGAASKSDMSFVLPGLFARQPYAVTMASVDVFGNIGPLSTVACATTQDDHGAAVDVLGRGGCSMGRANGARCSGALVALLAAAMLRARRRPN